MFTSRNLIHFKSLPHSHSVTTTNVTTSLNLKEQPNEPTDIPELSLTGNEHKL